MISPLRMLVRLTAVFLVGHSWVGISAQQVTPQDLDTILARADKLFEESKAAYEEARTKSSAQAFVDASFKLEEARIKYIVLQEIAPADKQKIAADRLRAVNQLSKLIHDGRVAITPRPEEPAPARPTDSAKPNDAPSPVQAPKGAPLPEPQIIDVSKRIPIPEASKLKDAEKEIKEVFKDRYAKKGQADRKAFARVLLENAAKSHQDPVSAWMFYRECQDMAVQACDIRTLIEAIDRLCQLFDVDGLALRQTGLTSAAKTTKSVDEVALVVDALIRLTDDLVAADQYDGADKAVNLAAQTARKANDPGLVSQVSTRAKEVVESKSLFQGMKTILETLAKNPEDAPANLEMGRFLCYVKGNWDLGCRFLVKGSDPVLKSLAEKELSAPTQSAELAALGEGWLNLAEKEKSPLRKSQLMAHAKFYFENALKDAPPLVRARIEKRLNDLNPLEEPATNGLVGRWFFSENSGMRSEDSSGKENHATLVGAVAWVPGVSSNALKFDGATSYATVGTTGLPAANAPQTIAWAQFYPATPPKNQSLLNYSDVNNLMALTLSYKDGKMVASKWNAVPLVSVEAPSINQWHYLAYVFDGKNHKLYLDGALRDTSTVPASQGSATRLEFGRWGGNPGAAPSGYFSGMLDDVRIYGRALSEAEVRGLVRRKK